MQCFKEHIPLYDNYHFPQLTPHCQPSLPQNTIWGLRHNLRRVDCLIKKASPTLAEWYDHEPTEAGCAEFVDELRLERKSIICSLTSYDVKKQHYRDCVGRIPFDEDGDGEICYRCIDAYFEYGDIRCHWCNVFSGCSWTRD